MNLRYLFLLTVFALVGPSVYSADSIHLIPDVLGVRDALQEKGVELTAQSTSDLLRSTMGGAVRGGTYSGLLALGTTVDLEKGFGWEGATLNSTWIWLYGNDLSTQDIGNSMLVSGIAGNPAFRCYQLWLEQKLFQDSLSVREGCSD